MTFRWERLRTSPAFGSSDDDENVRADISVAEVEEAVAKLRNDAAPGEDALTARMLRPLCVRVQSRPGEDSEPRPLTMALHRLFTLCWCSKTIS